MKQGMDRRSFVVGMTALGAVAAANFPSPAIASGIHEFKIVSSWQQVLPGLGNGAIRLAERINKMSGGRIVVTNHDDSSFGKSKNIFDAVSKGDVEMGYSAPHYWLGKNKAVSFFSGIPGGLVAHEQNGWIYFGGGKKLWEDLYAEYNLVPFTAGNTGTQMGGWFNREIESDSDFRNLKIRISGLGGEVMKRLGANVKSIEPNDLFTSLQSGIIDALEFVGPWNDMSLGLHRVAKYYYGPGFQDGNQTIELMVNKKAFDALPADIKEIISVACLAENNLMLAEYHANNIKAFQTLKYKHNIDMRKYPDHVMKRLLEVSAQVVAEIAKEGDLQKRIYDSYQAYKKYSIDMSSYTELGFMQARL